MKDLLTELNQEAQYLFETAKFKESQAKDFPHSIWSQINYCLEAFNIYLSIAINLEHSTENRGKAYYRAWILASEKKINYKGNIDVLLHQAEELGNIEALAIRLERTKITFQ